MTDFRLEANRKYLYVIPMECSVENFLTTTLATFCHRSHEGYRVRMCDAQIVISELDNAGYTQLGPTLSRVAGFGSRRAFGSIGTISGLPQTIRKIG